MPILRWMPFVMASALLGCHPQGAVVAGPRPLPALEQEVVETALRARIGDLSACLIDTDVVPGQQTTQMAAMQLSITDSGRVHGVTVQKVDDTDVHECIVRKASEWMFPRGGLTAANVELRFQSKAAEIATVRVVPSTRTATAR
jgi:hypothetical protein